MIIHLFVYLMWSYIIIIIIIIIIINIIIKYTAY